jgi:hypothetical protein
MRRLVLIAPMLAAACAEPTPIRVTTVPPPAAATGTPEQQAAQRLDRALAQDARRDRARGTDPAAAAIAGEPAPGTDLEIGGGDAPAAAPQIGIPLR